MVLTLRRLLHAIVGAALWIAAIAVGAQVTSGHLIASTVELWTPLWPPASSSPSGATTDPAGTAGPLCIVLTPEPAMWPAVCAQAASG